MFIECRDLLSQTSVFINPNCVEYLSETTEDQRVNVTVPTGGAATIVLPKGSFQVQFIHQQRLAIDADSGKALAAYKPPPIYTIDAKTLFQYNTEEGSLSEKVNPPPSSLQI